MLSAHVNAKGKTACSCRKQKIVYCHAPSQKKVLTSAVLPTSQYNLKLYRIKIWGCKLLKDPLSVIVHGWIAIDLNGLEMGFYILSMGDSPLPWTTVVKTTFYEAWPYPTYFQLHSSFIDIWLCILMLSLFLLVRARMTSLWQSCEWRKKQKLPA